MLPDDKVVEIEYGKTTNVEMHNEKIHTPKTGDESNPNLWLILGGTSAVGIAACATALVKKRKKNCEEADKTVITTQKKYKVLNKLFEAGFKTEKDLQSINFQNVFSIPNLTVQEMSIISELQTNTKGNKLYSYLGGNNDEQNNEC